MAPYLFLFFISKKLLDDITTKEGSNMDGWMEKNSQLMKVLFTLKHYCTTMVTSTLHFNNLMNFEHKFKKLIYFPSN
jgi:hypothetical protein